MQQQTSPTLTYQSFWLPWGVMVLTIALLVRLLWVNLFQVDIGGDAIRYLWISEHVRRGDWHLLPQLYSSPLLPVCIGLLSRLAGDPALVAKWLGVMMNTLSVGLAMAIIRRLFPTQPFLGWFIGAALAVNHVWCRLAPFAMTENLFYPLLMAFFWILLRCRQHPTNLWEMALGVCWGGLFLSREIGLYYGTMGFLAWIGALAWQNRHLNKMTQIKMVAKFSFPPLAVLSVILIGWMYWIYLSLGIVSLGEGPKFYATYTKQFDRQSEATYPGYNQGESAFFRLHPYEFMEYTRFPRPEDPRYPQGKSWQMLADPVGLIAKLVDNLVWSLKEFQRTTSVGFLVLFIYLPWRWWQGRVSPPSDALWLYGVNWSFLILTFLALVREARIIGWFFPWLYLGLGLAVNFVWTQMSTWLPGKNQQLLGKILLIILVSSNLLYPQYFKEVPRRWQVRQEPHVHQVAAAEILKNFGPNAIISSVQAEVAYRAGGYWIGQPNTDAKNLLEWLYLGNGDFLLINDRYGLGEGREILWSAPEEVEKTFPELKLVAGFEGLKNAAHGHKARLFRFTPNPQKMAEYRRIYPWAGTPPGKRVQPPSR